MLCVQDYAKVIQAHSAPRVQDGYDGVRMGLQRATRLRILRKKEEREDKGVERHCGERPWLRSPNKALDAQGGTQEPLIREPRVLHCQRHRQTTPLTLKQPELLPSFGISGSCP